ncbi:MAG: S41 family peptidase [Actinomycetota bacterium]|nr:S41 family peptidase [Actinomycetota bacterium]
MRALSSRAIRVGAVAVAVTAAFVGGVVTGSAGRPAPSRSPSAGLLDEVADHIAAQAIRPVDRESLDRAAVQGMLAALGDKWSAYYNTTDYEQFRDSLNGRYSGVGLWVRRDGDGPLLVSSVLPGSAAAAAGVRVGDEVTGVAGRAVVRRSVTDVVASLRGSSGTTVSVALRRGTESKLVTLRRDPIAAADVAVDKVAPTVSRIRVTAFTRGVGHDVRTAVERLGGSGSKGVVLDLRGNPGGLLDEAVEVASVFLDGGPVVSYARRDEAVRQIDATGHGNPGVPLVVLVDGGTASAAEVVTGALQDRGRAVVIGSRTFGKGSVQEPAKLSDGSAIELTVARYLTPNGRSLDGVGLDPDVDVAAGPMSPTSTDQAVTRGVEVLTSLLADARTAGRG